MIILLFRLICIQMKFSHVERWREKTVRSMNLTFRFTMTTYMFLSAACTLVMPLSIDVGYFAILIVRFFVVKITEEVKVRVIFRASLVASVYLDLARSLSDGVQWRSWERP